MYTVIYNEKVLYSSIQVVHVHVQAFIFVLRFASVLSVLDNF